MNLFKKLLRPAANDGSTTPAIMDLQPNDELFVDTVPPEQEATVPTETELDRMSAWNLLEEGRIAGFQYHDMDIYRAMVDQYRSQFNRAIDSRMKHLEDLLCKFDEEINTLQGESMSTTLKRITSTRVRFAKEHLWLSEQKHLVLGNSGMAEPAIASFSVGYRQGYNQYLETIGLMDQHTR